LSELRRGRVPRELGAAVAASSFVHDEISSPTSACGPFTRFLFILVAALLGLMPFAATSTGNRGTMGLALFVTDSSGGISSTACRPLPNWSRPSSRGCSVMVPVRSSACSTEPTPQIRFANMLAGHIIITTLILLISLIAEINWLNKITIAPVSILLALFIMLLEILVAFIQAYIFTLLSAIFIGVYAHPAH
jgi:F-type H+-transporting ATPase subunit a